MPRILVGQIYLKPTDTDVRVATLDGVELIVTIVRPSFNASSVQGISQTLFSCPFQLFVLRVVKMVEPVPIQTLAHVLRVGQAMIVTHVRPYKI